MSVLADALSDSSAWTWTQNLPGSSRPVCVFTHPVAGDIQVRQAQQVWTVGVYNTRFGSFYHGFVVPRSSEISLFWDDLDLVFGVAKQHRLQQLSDGIWAWAVSEHSISWNAEITLYRAPKLLGIKGRAGLVRLPSMLDHLFEGTELLLSTSIPKGPLDSGLSTYSMSLVAPSTMHERLEMIQRNTA